MAEDPASGAPSLRGCADGSDADPPDERVAEMEGEDQEQFEYQELLDCQVQLGTPEEREDVGLMAEAEAVASGWMLDFLCLSLCRAFRDSRSEDFQRTRNSAEGEGGVRRGPELRRGRRREPRRAAEACFPRCTSGGSGQRGWGGGSVGGPRIWAELCSNPGSAC
ncbi:telomeric repeat-binding factor 1-like [Nycticebus coucang]|uniref:telomeric repeat-binding factor 1-like n=1 Tax=Nycticebus coucang TaxID=9470 RepID=UPI00234C1694|nr:telomeric repeat-binding factor 1-like [Nycticebus coucang]